VTKIGEFVAERLSCISSDYDYENNQQDALYRLIYYSKSALLVSGDVFAHYQEHLTVLTVSGSVHPSCCRLVSRMSLTACEQDQDGTAVPILILLASCQLIRDTSQQQRG